MTDACCCQLLKVTLDHKSAPVSQHSVAVDHRVQQLSIGPLVHHLVLQISNIDCLKEHWGDPGLKQEPASKIDSSDNVIIASFRWKFLHNSFNKFMKITCSLVCICTPNQQEGIKNYRCVLHISKVTAE